MLTRPQEGLSFIYNVSSKVGPLQSDPNQPDDVMLVQYLLKKVLQGQQMPATPGVAFPTATGRFDTATGFWIYRVQSSFRNFGNVIDGVVSPARGLFYGPSTAWTIAILNFKFKGYFPREFDNLPNNPELSPSLRASLR
jgi:hypothetical protein